MARVRDAKGRFLKVAKPPPLDPALVARLRPGPLIQAHTRRATDWHVEILSKSDYVIPHAPDGADTS